MAKALLGYSDRVRPSSGLPPLRGEPHPPPARRRPGRHDPSSPDRERRTCRTCHRVRRRGCCPRRLPGPHLTRPLTRAPPAGLDETRLTQGPGNRIAGVRPLCEHQPLWSVGVVERVLPARLGTPFRWLLGSSWVSNIADGLQVAAGPLLVASETHDPFLVALAAVLQYLPFLLFGLFAGVVADRVDRRRMIVVADLLPRGGRRRAGRRRSSPARSTSRSSWRRCSCSAWGRPSRTPPPRRCCR